MLLIIDIKFKVIVESHVEDIVKCGYDSTGLVFVKNNEYRLRVQSILENVEAFVLFIVVVKSDYLLLITQ